MVLKPRMNFAISRDRAPWAPKTCSVCRTHEPDSSEMRHSQPRTRGPPVRPIQCQNHVADQRGDPRHGEEDHQMQASASDQAAGTWQLHTGAAPTPAARVTISDDTAWRLFFTARKSEDLLAAVTSTAIASWGRGDEGAGRHGPAGC